MKKVRVEEMLREGAEPPFLSRSELWRLNAFMRGGVVFVVRLLPEHDVKMVHDWWRNAVGNAIRSEVRASKGGRRELRIWRVEP